MPAYNLLSKHEAVEELAARGLSTEALEQKCIQQVTNVELAPGALARQIGLWERAIDESMLALSTIEMEVVEVSWADRQ